MSAPAGARTSAREWAVRLLLCVPFLALVAKELAWLRYGIDLPFWDDWRAYQAGQATSVDPAYLFAPANGTKFRKVDALDRRPLLAGRSGSSMPTRLPGGGTGRIPQHAAGRPR